MKKIIFFLSLSVLFACNRDDETVDCSNAVPPPNSFNISFVNAAGDPLLDTQFLQDSFKLSSINSVQYLKRSNNNDPSVLPVFFESIESDAVYQLELDSENIDKLQFNFTVSPGDCGNGYSINSINYNDAPFLEEGDVLTSSNIIFTRN